MYLKKIVTSGFKSFADKVDLFLDDKITCIVGPNGSGKSNIVDAVRWVLGEQSVKSLRGENSMSDVIFSGSKSRKPLNVASVELIFDNQDHFLNVPYTEIAIKRRVYRSGENEYYLNGERCRLKDINNLLLDSGMGKESFNIISQGEVERILSDSPSERRIIFEEAAGILKYKKRKEEALRKLDRTHSNLDRANDIINELELQVEPLKEQSEKAKEYLDNKQGLDNYEVALLAYDIENYNQRLQQANLQKEKLEKEIIKLSNETSKNDALVLEDNHHLEKLEIELSSLQRELLQVTEEVEKINGEKNLFQERSKVNKKEHELQEEMRVLIEKKAQLEGQIQVVREDLANVVSQSKVEEKNAINLEQQLDRAKSEKNMLNQDYTKRDQNMVSYQHKIESLKTEIEQGGDIPNSVRSVLKATTLTGIHNTIGNILSVSDDYVKALNVAIAANKNFIITSDEEAAKKAIYYLKDNHLGRATFFPLSIIQRRYVDADTLRMIEKDPDFVGVLSDLVQYNGRYRNIVENQLGMVLLATDMNAATRLSEKIKRRYKIVTLDGDVVNVGGSMSGGSLAKTRSVVMMKQELHHMEEQCHYLEQEQKEITEEISSIQQKITELEEKIYLASKNKVSLREKYDQKNNELKQLQQELEVICQEVSSVQSIQENSISEKEQELIQKYHEKSALKEKIQIRITSLRTEIDTLKSKIEEVQATDKLRNSSLRNLEKEMRELEVQISRYDVKIDSMLQTLNEEYELTFEKAKAEYHLDLEPEEARIKVNTYRANIIRIGLVNLAAIEEYERVSSRYTFLMKQKEDLMHAEETLLEIMNEMDDVMKEEFQHSFQAIQEEFQKVFKELFGGGHADLKLTDPSDLLTTGIEIVASPPGKKLTTISLLSGGEKTLTAISLLFAILNVRTVPFCLFDEVEAALDEANVSQFGKYLNHYQNKTQFLIITHKKKTMEYANTLYGITMQESGVSKLVSVKLNDTVDTL